MIFYTGLEDSILNRENDWQEIEINVKGDFMVAVRPEGLGKATVLRIMSSDPQDYLRSEYQPGMQINLQLYRNNETEILGRV